MSRIPYYRLLPVFLMSLYALAAQATESQERLVRGLWSLTTQADRIEPRDLQRALGINPSHYVQTEEGPPWQTMFTLTEKYQSEADTADPITAIHFGLGELVNLEGPPRDVGTRQKIAITFKSNVCVRADAVQAIAHVARASTTPVKFQDITARMKSSLALDSECAKSVVISKLIISPPFSPSPRK